MVHSAPQMSDKEQKERALQEKLDKRAAIVAGVVRKLITSYYAGRQQMLDDARAVEAVKRAAKGKKAGRAKKAAKDSKEAKAGAKKPPPTPVQQAWLSFLADMDERISKQKRVFLEDMYRGVGLLDAQEHTRLAALLAATTPKVLAPSGLNITQLNIKEALAAACAACCLPEACALPSGSLPGLMALQDKGASAPQLLQYGFKEADLLRVGYPCHAVVEAAQHDLPALRAAGVSVPELLACPDTPQLSSQLTQGLQGVAQLKQAGYSAVDLLGGGLSNPWALAAAGFSLQELADGGVAPGSLRAAGYGQPEGQPAGFLAGGMRAAVASLDAGLLPQLQEGTQAAAWRVLLEAPPPPAPGAGKGGRASSRPSPLASATPAAAAAAAVGAPRPRAHVTMAATTSPLE